MKTEDLSCNRPQLNLSGGIVFCEGKILFTNKNSKWDLPTGKLERGESLASCAIRETSEETGVVWNELSIVRYMGTTDNVRKHEDVEYQKLVHWYQMSYTLGTNPPLVPDSGKEISDCAWFSLEEVTKLTITRDLKEFVSQICEYSEEMLDLS